MIIYVNDYDVGIEALPTPTITLLLLLGANSSHNKKYHIVSYRIVSCFGYVWNADLQICGYNTNPNSKPNPTPCYRKSLVLWSALYWLYIRILSLPLCFMEGVLSLCAKYIYVCSLVSNYIIVTYWGRSIGITGIKRCCGRLREHRTLLCNFGCSWRGHSSTTTLKNRVPCVKVDKRLQISVVIRWQLISRGKLTTTSTTTLP